MAIKITRAFLLWSYVDNRDNNFNLLRVIAAFLVLYNHCYVLSTGSSSYDPLKAELGVSIGGIAVNIFFVTSGFLATASLLIRRSAVFFLRASALRIYPALIMSQLMTVLILGTLLTALPFKIHIGNIL